MNSKVTRYLIAGVILTYFGLKDDDFVLWYNGVALVMGLVAFFYAYKEYEKNKEEKNG